MDIVTLLDTLLASIFKAEEDFFNNPNDFYSLESSVKSSTDSFAAGFLGAILSDLNQSMCLPITIIRQAVILSAYRHIYRLEQLRKYFLYVKAYGSFKEIVYLNQILICNTISENTDYIIVLYRRKILS